MTDFAPDWKKGESRGKPCEVVVCEAATDIAQGDMVQISGHNGDLQPKVIVQDDKSPLGQAQFAAKSGELVKITTRGFIKVEFGTALGVIDALGWKDNECVATGTSGAVGSLGYIYGKESVADGDFTIIFFGGTR